MLSTARQKKGNKDRNRLIMDEFNLEMTPRIALSTVNSSDHEMDDPLTKKNVTSQFLKDKNKFIVSLHQKQKHLLELHQKQKHLLEYNVTCS